MSHKIIAQLVINIDGTLTVAATVALPNDMTDNMLNEYVKIKAIEMTRVPIGTDRTPQRMSR